MSLDEPCPQCLRALRWKTVPRRGHLLLGGSAKSTVQLSLAPPGLIRCSSRDEIGSLRVTTCCCPQKAVRDLNSWLRLNDVFSVADTTGRHHLGLATQTYTSRSTRDEAPPWIRVCSLGMWA